MSIRDDELHSPIALGRRELGQELKIERDPDRPRPSIPREEAIVEAAAVAQAIP